MDSLPSEAASTSVLFVCLGNICRSPLAEGIFRHLVDEAGLTDNFFIDSAGTGAWHVGEAADGRMMVVARQVTAEDLDRFDYVIAMDRSNLQDLQRMVDLSGADVSLHLLREFDPENEGDEVPDPYYGGASGFEQVYKIVYRSCQRFLEHVRAA